MGVRPDCDDDVDDPFELELFEEVEEVTLDTDLCRPEATLSRYSDLYPWSLSTKVSCMRSERGRGEGWFLFHFSPNTASLSFLYRHLRQIQRYPTNLSCVCVCDTDRALANPTNYLHFYQVKFSRHKSGFTRGQYHCTSLYTFPPQVRVITRAHSLVTRVAKRKVATR